MVKKIEEGFFYTANTPLIDPLSSASAELPSSTPYLDQISIFHLQLDNNTPFSTTPIILTIA